MTGAVLPGAPLAVGLSLFALLALAGCGYGKVNPFASFDNRCAQLPGAQFDVVQAPVSYREDSSQSIATLTQRSGTLPATTQRTVGLTTATIGYQAQIDLRSVSDSRGGRACGTPNVHVELSLQPMTVYVANELADNRCEHESTLEHELKHVAVHREALEAASAELRDALPRRSASSSARRRARPSSSAISTSR